MSNRNLRSCYAPWQNSFDKHVNLKPAATFRYERDATIRAPWDNTLEAFEASLEPFKTKLNLFLSEFNVVMLKLEDATNLRRLFEMHRDHHMTTLLSLSEEDEWNAFQAMVLEEGTFKAQVKNILHHHTDIKVKEYKGDERINTLKDK